jgi:malonate decarboxylase epsilon subunit
MSVLFAFPGQGSQRPGLLHRLPNCIETQLTLQEANDVLDRHVLELDDADALRSTVAVQLCLLIAGVTGVRILAARGATAAAANAPRELAHSPTPTRCGWWPCVHS